MSLISQALVIMTSYLLEDKTWAGRQIKKQPIDPLSDVLQGGEVQRPFLAVYVDNARINIEGRATNGTDSWMDLKIFVHISPGVTVTTDPSTNEQIFELTLDTATAGLTMNIVARQIDHAFHVPGVWFDVWNRFVLQVQHRDMKYVLYQTEDKAHVPTMEITYRIRTVPDPMHAGKLEALKGWSLLDQALRARGGEAIQVAEYFKMLIEDGSDVPDYQQFVANFGLTSGGLAAFGGGPVVDGATNDDGTTPQITSIENVTEVEIVPSED